MSLPVAVLAGGLATRLRPLTGPIPKALVEVAGRPFVEHQLEWLRGQGVERVVLCVAYRGEMIRDALGDGARWGLSIEYVFDGDRLRGTGGAIMRALPALGPTFMVLYADSYVSCDLAALERAYRASGCSGMMTVFRNDDRWDRSNVLFAEGRVLRYDKVERTQEMHHIDYGIGVLSARAFEGFLNPGSPTAGNSTDDAFDLAAVYQRLLAAGDLAAFEVFDRFYEIGSPDGLEETRRFFDKKEKA
ncbi:MAG TPA: nucleotidyltransferase family protein [Vicinamibacterales bacterium]|nr:nucleotidyltransferase family protein [Vicinamibacterales bacterium]